MTELNVQYRNAADLLGRLAHLGMYECADVVSISNFENNSVIS